MVQRLTDLNPIQEAAEARFNAAHLNNAELKSDPNNGAKGDDLNADESGIKPDYLNNVTGRKTDTKPGGFLGNFKKSKKGPLALIITIALVGGFAMTTFFSPGLLLIQIKEIMVIKLNAQLTSMRVREEALLKTKISDNATTKGFCTSVINVACRYSTFSPKEVANFKEAGIDIVESEGGSKTLFGNTKPKSFKFNGETILAKDFNDTYIKNTSFRSAVDNGYNPKVAGFFDKFWEYASAKLGISKVAANITGDTNEEKLKSIQEDTKIKTSDGTEVKSQLEAEAAAEKEAVAAGKTITTTPNTVANSANNIMDIAGRVSASAKGVKIAAIKASPEILNAIEVPAKAAGAAVSIIGDLDAKCTAYGLAQSLGYATKTVRALQLARYAMIFLNVADQIKAGVAKPEDVSYLGTILTTELAANTAAGTAAVRSAADSYGYKYAAYGDTGPMPTSASQFLTGGGLTGQASNLMSIINSALFNAPRKVCSYVKQPAIMYGSLAVGALLLLFPIADVAVSTWDIAKISAIAGFLLSSSYLTSLLADIIAGVLVDNTTVGENAGDAITSGASAIMGTAAQSGGNAPLTPDQAVKYNELSNNINEQYAEEDRLAYSPFDITNSNTFMGSLVSKLIPYASKMSSMSGIFNSIASLTTGSLSLLSSQATNAEDKQSNYEMCTDFDYNDLAGDGTKLKLATDPYCNVSYGIPTDALNADPISVSNTLLKQGQIDEITGEPTGVEYNKFINDCINRQAPLGYAGEDSRGSNGSECIFGSKITMANNEQITNNNFYIHYIDQRVENGMSGADTTLAAAMNSGAGQKGISFFNSTNLNSTALNTGGGR